MKKINVVVAEDHDFFRNGLISALQDIDFINVVAEACNGQELVNLLKTTQADIVLTDIKMPIMDGLDATKIIKSLYPEIKIIILTLHNEEYYFLKMIEYGVHGYILKNTNKENLERALQLIKEDKQYFSEDLLPILANPFKINSSKENINKLTKREIEVLQQISKGLTNSEIAEKLFISPKTVINHRANLMSKTGARNSVALVRFAFDNKLISN